MTGALSPLERLPPRPDGLDPRLAAFIEALALDAAQIDHRAAMAAKVTKEEMPCHRVFSVDGRRVNEDGMLDTIIEFANED